MDPLKELPMGLGMALAQNTQAMKEFCAMDKSEQQEIINHTHNIRSKSEMKAFVDSIAPSGV